MRGKNTLQDFRQRLSGVVAAARSARSRKWSRPKLASAVGVAALIAGGAAAALVATGAGAPHADHAYADTALSTRDGLRAIYKLHPDLGKPVTKLITEQKLPKPAYEGDHGTIGVPKGVLNPTTTAPGAVTGYRAGPYTGDLTPLQLASLALRAGCSPSASATAAAIAAAESGGNPGAQGDIALMDSTWDWSEGLWQIRGLRAERGTGGLRDSIANADPLTNAHAMYVISSGCTNWAPWTTYASGAYLSYLPLMKSAVESAVGYKIKTGAYPAVLAGAGPVSVPSAERARGLHHAASHRAHRHRHVKSHRRASTRHSHHGRPARSPIATSPVRTPHPSSTPAGPPAPTKSSVKPPKPPKPSLPTSILPSLPTSHLPTSSLPSLPTSGIPSLP